MFDIRGKAVLSVFMLVIIGTTVLGGVELDKSKYITVDEIKPGMDAYCLTTYSGTKIERFDLEVLSVLHNYDPGRDSIVVQGTDARFIHTGPVAGCSGSPVYIDGRLAGALAYAWPFSKDPLYRVTPIAEMLEVGHGRSYSSGEMSVSAPAFSFDMSKPLDFAEIESAMISGLKSRKSGPLGSAVLPCPLVISGLPMNVCGDLEESLAPLGFMPVAGAGGSNADDVEDAELVPGASLAVPMVTGDVSMTAMGTVTDVVGDRVYGFGHSFLGYGGIDLPMATGRIHTVVSSVMRSFKLGDAVEVVGALRADESAAVSGLIGAKAHTIPMTITVDRYNDTGKRTFNCRVADNRLFTPVLIRSAVQGAATALGDFPPDNTLKYKVNMAFDNGKTISFENVSTNFGAAQMLGEAVGAIGLLMNNPYEKVSLESVDFDFSMSDKSIGSRIWTVDLSDSKVKPGAKLDVSVVIESILAPKKKYGLSIDIPKNLKPGQYDLIVTGAGGYKDFIRKNAPYKLLPENLESTFSAIDTALSIKRDRLYCIVVLPSSGLAIATAELPDLPATQALVLTSGKRTVPAVPYMNWVENSVVTGTVVAGMEQMKITVEK